LQSGDLVIEASEKFSDYRDQFVSDEEFHQTSAEYCRQAGLPDEGKDVVDHLRGTLSETADKVDAGFPDNEYLEIENGEPILRRGERRHRPENLSLIEQLMREQIPAVSLLDAMMDTEKWGLPHF
jgi:hypothetical protein